MPITGRDNFFTSKVTLELSRQICGLSFTGKMTAVTKYHDKGQPGKF
jgi:hypothetical protein